MKKRIFILLLLLIITGVIVALAVFPEFRVFWQNTPVLSSIYTFVDKYFHDFLLNFTSADNKFLYLSILGVILITILIFGLLKVKKVKLTDSYKKVSITPTIKSADGKTTIIVVEEN